MTYDLTLDVVTNIPNRYHYSFPVIDAKQHPIEKVCVKVDRWPKHGDSIFDLQEFVDDLG